MILAHRRHQLFNSVVRGILFLSLALTSRLSAQTDPRLVEAVRLAQEGMGDSARASVNRVINQLTPTDSLYPQALYTLGLVSRSVDEMRRQYTRVAVEYTYSDWADDALVRLGMLDYAGGNPQGTLQQMGKVPADSNRGLLGGTRGIRDPETGGRVSLGSYRPCRVGRRRRSQKPARVLQGALRRRSPAREHPGCRYRETAFARNSVARGLRHSGRRRYHSGRRRQIARLPQIRGPARLRGERRESSQGKSRPLP